MRVIVMAVILFPLFSALGHAQSPPPVLEGTVTHKYGIIYGNVWRTLGMGYLESLAYIPIVMARGENPPITDDEDTEEKLHHNAFSCLMLDGRTKRLLTGDEAKLRFVLLYARHHYFDPLKDPKIVAMLEGPDSKGAYAESYQWLSSITDVCARTLHTVDYSSRYRQALEAIR